MLVDVVEKKRSNKIIIVGLLFSLVVVSAAGLYLVGSRASHHATEVWIDAPPDAVFPWLHEPQRLSLWLAGFVESKPVNEGPVGLGSESIDLFDERGRRLEMRTEVTAWEPPKTLRVSVESSFVLAENTYRLEAEANGTRVRFAGDFRYRGITRCFAPFLGGTVQKRQESDLARLKAAAAHVVATTTGHDPRQGVPVNHPMLHGVDEPLGVEHEAGQAVHEQRGAAGR